jgi:hypothetical protein
MRQFVSVVCLIVGMTLLVNAQTKKESPKTATKSTANATKAPENTTPTTIVPIPPKDPKSVVIPKTDEDLRAATITRLLQSQPLQGSKIEVEVKNGVTKLTGTVKYERLREYAESIAKDFKNVKSVTNLLKAEQPLSEREKNGLRMQEALEKLRKNTPSATAKPAESNKTPEKPAAEKK